MRYLHARARIYLVVACMLLGGVLSGAPALLAESNSTTTPRVRVGKTLTGAATVYPDLLNGHKTTSGETFHQTGHTAASNSIPLQSRVKVTNLENGKSTDVKVNDRGPKLGKHKIDLSKKAAHEIGLTAKQGKVPVAVQVTGAESHTTKASTAPERMVP